MPQHATKDANSRKHHASATPTIEQHAPSHQLSLISIFNLINA